MSPRPLPTSLQRSRGAALIASLMILIVLTLLVLVAVRGSTLMERLVGNSRQLDQAFQTTEAALRQGEALLEQPVLPDVINTAGWYHYEAKPAPDWTTPTAWDASANGKIAYRIGDARAQIAIEELPAVPDPGGGLNPTEQPQESTVYRVSARGYSERGDTFVILQTTYRR
jgi:type IV pilus assembly protein PilX